MKAAKTKIARIPPADPAAAPAARSRTTHESNREIVASERRWLLGQISSQAVAAPRESSALPLEPPAHAPPARPTPSGSNYRVVLACTSGSNKSPDDTV